MTPLTVGRVVVAIIVCACVSAAHSRASSMPTIMSTEIGGHVVRVQTSGVAGRAAGTPVVVFESGVGNGLEAWSNVIPQLAGTTPLISYDRAGLGGSSSDGQPPTPRHTATRLHALLESLGVEAPVVLVGHSWGGMLARYFAGYYPEDVVGMVLIDPGPMVTQPSAEILMSFNSIGGGQPAFDAYWSAFVQLFARAQPAVQSEVQMLRDLMHVDVSQRDIHPIRDIPLAIVLAGKYVAVPVDTETARLYDARAQFDADLRYRIRVLQEWVLASSHGSLIVASNATHSVMRDDPGLVMAAIRRVLTALGH